MGAIDLYTESQDFIRALYRALPCAVRAGEWRTGPKGGRFFKPGKWKAHRFDTMKQIEALGRNWDKIDWGRAALNVLENQVEDQLIGMNNKFMADALGARTSWNDYARFKVIQKEFRDVSSEMSKGSPSRHQC